MPTIFFMALTKSNKDNDIRTSPPVACNAVPSFLFIILQSFHNPAIVTANATIEDIMLLNFTFESFLSAPTNKFSDTENASKEITLLLAPGTAFDRAVNATNPAAILASINKRV